MSKLRAYVRLARPFTLVFPAISGLVFAILGLKLSGQLHDIRDILHYWIPITAGVIVLFCCNSLSNITNQCFDLVEDRLHPQKRKRPIANGELTEKEGLVLVIFGLILIMFLCSFVNQTFTALVSIIMLFALLYSIPPIRLKKRLALNNLCIAIPRGLLGVLASVSIVTNPFQLPVICIGIVLMIFTFGGNTTKDLSDCKEDSQAGILNLVTYFGVRRAMIIASAFVFLSYVAFVLFTAYWHILPFKTLYLLLLVPLGAVMIFFMCFKAETVLSQGNNASWFLFYAHVGLYAIGFVAVYFL